MAVVILAAAVEHQLVVAADEVAVNQRAAALGRELREQHVPAVLLAEAPRRGGEVEQQFRAGGGQFLGGTAVVAAVVQEHLVVPDVLADGDAHLGAEDLHRRVIGRRLEVAILVEHVVGRQQRLVANGGHLTALEDGGGVAGWPAGVGLVYGGVANDDGRPAAALGQAIERLPVLAEERRLGQQVARRVAAQRQLRQQDQRRTGLVGALPHPGDHVGVPVEVADGGVDLCDGNLHSPLGQVYR